MTNTCFALLHDTLQDSVSVLQVAPELSDKSVGKQKAAPTLVDTNTKRRSGRERGLIGTILHTGIHAVAYPFKKGMHEREVKQRAAAAEGGLPEHGDFLLRHFMVATIENVKAAPELPTQTLLMLPIVRSDWCVFVLLKMCAFEGVWLLTRCLLPPSPPGTRRPSM